MNGRVILGSLTRITDFEQRAFDIEALPRPSWRFADYVVGKVVRGHGPYSHAELKTGRLVEIVSGDLVMGVLGTRAATLETCGDWSLIESDLLMNQMSPAGLFGKETSRSHLLPELPLYRYIGHVRLDGETRNMGDYACSAELKKQRIPVILIVGTSMSAGKTATAKVIIRQLKALGLSVVGSKLTGAGRYRDILSMQDAGADHIFDFVDGGLPSTVCSKELYSEAMANLLSRIEDVEADVMVAEVGASPLEPYNGETAVKMLQEQIRFSVLCASDPYAVKGLTDAFGFHPRLVSGPCTNTQAGVALIERLCALPSINILNVEEHQVLRELLKKEFCS